MRSRNLIYSNDARNQLKDGIDALADMVKKTLGPGGRNVVIDRGYGPAIVTKDGVTVAKEIFLSNNIANLGAQLLKEVASKTNDRAGDGTTTATVLAQAIVKEGLKHVAAGVNPIELKRGIDQATRAILSALDKAAIPVSSKEDIVRIGAISANNEREIGQIIADAMEAVGEEGTLTIEDGTGIETYYEVVEGMKFERGYKSPYFVNNDAMECILENPVILILNERLTDIQGMANVMQLCSGMKRSLLVIADEISPDVTKLMVLNKMKGSFNSCAVLSPAFGDRRRDMMNDIAVLTGGTVVSSETGITLSNITSGDLGSCKKCTITKASTLIIGGCGSSDAIVDRINSIKVQRDAATEEFDRQRYSERLARLAGGIGVLYIGAATEAELKEKKDRIVDALHATRAAAAEGVVDGGGLALIKVREVLKNEVFKNTEQELGGKIVYHAVKLPFMTILENAGENGDLILKELLDSDRGYDVLTRMYGDSMYDLGIIDPVRVTKSALENAASIAGLFLTTEGIVAASQKERDYNERLLDQMPIN
jgi:chaperonin GroEL